MTQSAEDEAYRMVVGLAQLVSPEVADETALGLITGAVKALREITEDRLSERELMMKLLGTTGRHSSEVLAILGH